jgi:hypothetical protein
MIANFSGHGDANSRNASHSTMGVSSDFFWQIRLALLLA